MNKVVNFIDLHSGEEDKKKVLDNVKSNISFRGSSLWILACAIVVASVGLNVNSTAVIIGAMLISPLMGPIVGAGFGLGIYDFNLLKRSLKNLFIATVVSLVVSTIYFFLSPFKDTQSELLARTSPNIYDIFIAFFGGLVGVIAITRVEKGNPIPGVAIATALMPPLCTAGYGLALGNFRFFFGAMYLYTINCVFICIATFIIVKYLKYPIVKQTNLKTEKKVKYMISFLTLALIVPSVFFAYQLFQEKKYKQKVEQFLKVEFIDKGFTVLYKKTQFTSNPKKIDIAFLRKRLDKDEIKGLNAKLKTYELNNTVLNIIQDTTDLKQDILNEITFNNKTMSEKDLIIAKLQSQITSLKFDNNAILNETRILFPEIENIAIANHVFNENKATKKVITVVLYESKKDISAVEKQKLSAWLKNKFKTDVIEMYKRQ
ncbi:TIGR00341 family protein [Flavobacterium caseinilyticum]|uniref:TIGR00341 family protein n=1 Tax=Flavobacterium caseinilyticum TaxID=2541732 RepID=A0A4R5ASY2_9FLAO|nr:TIGR00341 family protein [Flavobacterium caseinilyticum]TDD74214.1 TIGR00341 family protein [Flavobacterium caseinilyticum]